MNPEEMNNNSALQPLLDNWSNEPSDTHFDAVLKELFEGTSSLLVPIAENENDERGMQLSSVYNMEGLMVLGAFSSEQSLFKWAEQEIPFTTMTSQVLIDFCQHNGIGRIIINSNQPDMFVLEGTAANVDAQEVAEDTPVRIGPLPGPLPEDLVEKLKTGFATISSVETVYLHGQLKDGEMAAILSVQASPVSDNTQLALEQMLSKSLEGQPPMILPVGLMLIPDADWLETVKDIEGALFYER